jgi:hypothetical protein
MCTILCTTIVVATAAVVGAILVGRGVAVVTSTSFACVIHTRAWRIAVDAQVVCRLWCACMVVAVAGRAIAGHELGHVMLSLPTLLLLLLVLLTGQTPC